MKKSGEIDYSAIHDSIKTIEKVSKNNNPLIVLRSTAIPGTTEMLENKYKFNFAYNPEFLREKKALSDLMETNRIVIGANRFGDYEKVERVYLPIFSKNRVAYIHVNTRTAEMIKYAANAMLTCQIAIANELYQICEALKIDYDNVRKAISLDPRIAKNIKVPGPDGDLGFGGKCFPKDLNAIIHFAREKGYRPHLFEEVWRLNEKIRGNKDWLNIPGATSYV